MSDEQERLMNLFAEALSKHSAEERAGYLAEACGEDAVLRRRVEALLEAHAQAGDFLGESTRFVNPEPSVDEGPGAVIGRYKLLQLIGEGGFGRVYMAEQLEPVRRKVAFKIIKLGMDTREVVARFEAERQALALMDHPNIAQVHDGGATPAGRPYFVMELVKGMPLTEYCDEIQLATADRLQLFVQVCHAVQHAHQKGVIHRDLKPSNILVTLHDGKPVPKIIDFGIAKAIGQPLTDKTLFTRFEQLIGTPAYMSPEQAALSGLDVDTRSDIYSLGVLLYELLTGTTPLERETLRQAALDEVRRLIRETEPPKPSTRLRSLGPCLTEVATRRHVEPSLLSREVRGDLDWIVMKALEKDRQRRYESAGAFAVDIERHLRHEPVTARPPSRSYRAGKFVRRHRVGVAMVAVVSVALLVGLALALVGFNRASEQAAIARAVSNFLQQDLLTYANPDLEPDRDLKVRMLLDRAATNIVGRFADQPLVEAEIRSLLGTTYMGLGEYSEAEPHLQQAVELFTKQKGEEHKDTLRQAVALASLREKQGQTSHAEESYRKILDTQRRILGPEHSDTLATLTRLGTVCTNKAEGERLLRDALAMERRTLGQAHAQTLNTMHLLSARYMEAGNQPGLVELLREIVEISRRVKGPENPQTLIAMHNLAYSYLESEQWESAEERFRETVALERRVLGPDHPNTTAALGELATTLQFLGRDSEPEQLLQEVVERESRVLGPQHPATLHHVERLAMLASYLGHWTLSWKQHQALCAARPHDYAVAAEGALDGWLAGDAAGYRALCAALIEQFGRSTNADVAELVARACLLVPDSLPSLEPALALADLAATSNTNSPRFRTVKGMAEYRRGDISEAAQWLAAPRDAPTLEMGALAGCYFAMAKQRLQETEAAQAALVQVDKRLPPGIVGLLSSRDLVPYLISRTEAERVVHRRDMSPPFNGATIAAARAEWAPVRKRLLQAMKRGSEQKWREARDNYLEAVADPAFTWIKAELDWAKTPYYMALVMLMAGDYEAHERICRGVFASQEVPLSRFQAETRVVMWLVRPQNRSSEVTQQALDFLRFIPETSPLDQAQFSHWTWRVRGLAAYRQGALATAAEWFHQAGVHAGTGDLGCRGPATLYLAMVRQQSGRPEEARQLLLAGEEMLSEPLRTFTGSSWNGLCRCALALEEARRVFFQTNAASRQPAGPSR